MELKDTVKSVGNLALIALRPIFYFLIVFFGIVLLAAVQVRSAGGATYDTWRLNYQVNRELNKKLLQELNNEETRDRQRNNANNLSWCQVCLRLFDENGLLKEKLLDPATTREIAEAKQKNTSLEKLTGDVFCVVKGYTWLQNDLSYTKRVVADDDAEIRDLEKSLTTNTEQYADLIKGRQDLLAFKEMEQSRYWKPFVAVPYDLLVALLVMFMGALGGMVRLLRDYGAANHLNPTPGEYWLIPLIGAVVAIGGYVLAKSGLLLLSSAGGESSLSPFMISLVGIVSGLLAKEVVDTIAIKGSEFLHGSK